MKRTALEGTITSGALVFVAVSFLFFYQCLTVSCSLSFLTSLESPKNAVHLPLIGLKFMLWTCSVQKGLKVRAEDLRLHHGLMR